jgi:hypothetical protein
VQQKIAASKKNPLKLLIVGVELRFHYKQEDAMVANVYTALGSRPDSKKIEKGKSPIILQAQVDGFVQLKTREELQQWQDDLKTYFGISMDASGLAGIACECCCGGCSDMCDLMA